jgi:hypothetical protein
MFRRITTIISRFIAMNTLTKTLFSLFLSIAMSLASGIYCSAQTLTPKQELMMINTKYLFDTKVIASTSNPLVAIGTTGSPVQLTNTQTGKTLYLGTPLDEKGDQWEKFNVLGFADEVGALWVLTRGNTKQMIGAVSYSTETGLETDFLKARYAYLSQDGGTLIYNENDIAPSSITFYNTKTKTRTDSINLGSSLSWIFYPKSDTVWYAILNGDSNNTMRIYSKRTNRQITTEPMVSNSVYTGGTFFDWSNDGKYYALGSRNPLTNRAVILVVERETKRIIVERVVSNADGRFAQQVSFSPNGRYVSYPLLNKVATIDLNNNFTTDTTSLSMFPVMSVAWLNTSQSFVTSNGTTSLQYNHQAKRSEKILTVQEMDNSRFYDNDKKILMVSRKAIYAMDLVNQSVIWQNNMNDFGVNAYNYDIHESKDLISYVEVNTPRKLIIHSLQNPELVRGELDFDSDINLVRFSSKGNYVCVGQSDSVFTIVDLRTIERNTIKLDSWYVGTVIKLINIALDEDEGTIVVQHNEGNTICLSLDGTIKPDKMGNLRRSNLVCKVPLKPEGTKLYGKMLDYSTKCMVGRNGINAQSTTEIAVYNYATSDHVRMSTYPDNISNDEAIFTTICGENRVAVAYESGRVALWDWKQDKLLTTLQAPSGFDYYFALTPMVISSSVTPQVAYVTNNRRFIISSISESLLSIDENMNVQNPIALYPQPSSDVLTVFMSQEKHCKTVSIYNLLGEEVFSFLPASNSFTIPTKQLTEGVYLLRATLSNDSKLSRTFVVRR